ncbi:hypothetical protein CPB83DRAFT_859453 [Crepidotus variabilis]|uniref:F-box domain-containing protein n=1 Tax=Crepidotus variabilis TaxID=179855 RepID=A0A9P6JMD0_9AGAR|nr:hypothetical protein CPB83DRAFT_859453 [Crepidotus variabilis]
MDAEDEIPFYSLLNSGFIPREEDAFIIKDILNRQVVEAASLENQIAPIKAMYEVLLNCRHGLQSSIKGLQGLVSLPRRNRIPEDILREIFLRCLPDTHDAVIHPNESPILLTHICSSWRRVALSTPLLWSTIHLPLYNSPSFYPPIPPPTSTELEENVQARERVIQTWLDRSSTCPLSLTLIDLDLPPASQKIFNLIVSSSHRWRSMKFSTSHQRIQTMSESNQLDLSVLQNLEIELQATGSWESHNLIPQAHSKLQTSPLFSAPNIRHFSLSSFMAPVGSLPIKWEGLTQMKLAYNDHPKTVAEMLSLLRPCRKLVSFSILISHTPVHFPNQTVQNFTSDDDGSVVYLPDLVTFEISSSAATSSPDEFSRLHMPSLKNLTYSYPVLPGTHTPLVSLTQSYTIRSLSISTSTLREDDFLQCLRCCKELTSLTLFASESFVVNAGRIENKDDILKSLSLPDADGEILCPKLENLQHSVGSFIETHWSDEEVLNFVKRKQAGKPGLSKLKRLAIIFGRVQTIPLAKELEQFVNDGLEICLQYSIKMDWMKPMAYNSVGAPLTPSIHNQSFLPSNIF